MIYNSLKELAEKANLVNLDSVINTLVQYKPRHIRKSLWLVYNRLTYLLALDNGENDVCSGDDNLPEALQILREIIDAIDEMDDMSNKKLSVVVLPKKENEEKTDEIEQ